MASAPSVAAVIGAIHHDTDPPSGPLEPTLLAELLCRSPLLAPGTRIGRYVVNRTVGAGGMGRVYLRPTTRRSIAQVALKLLHPGTAPEANLEGAPPARPSETMARLAHHPEIVPVYDAGRFGGTGFSSSSRWSSGRRGRRCRALSSRRSRGRGKRIVALLRHAGHGACTRPRGGPRAPATWLDSGARGRGRARLRDHATSAWRACCAKGRARHHLRHGRPWRGRRGRRGASRLHGGPLVGTPAYMAPEQLRDGEAEHAWPWTSSQLLRPLYEALYGERPFKGNSVEELLAATSAGRLSPPRTPLLALASRTRPGPSTSGLWPNPEDRYRSMNELLEALDRGTSKRSRSRAPVVVSVFAAASVATGIAFEASGRPNLEAPPSAPAAMVEESRVEATASAPSAPPAPSTALRVVSAAARSPARARPLHPRPGLSAPVKAAADPDVSIVEGRNGAPIMR